MDNILTWRKFRTLLNDPSLPYKDYVEYNSYDSVRLFNLHCHPIGEQYYVFDRNGSILLERWYTSVNRITVELFYLRTPSEMLAFIDNMIIPAVSGRGELLKKLS